MKISKYISRDRLGKIFLYMLADVIIILFSILVGMFLWHMEGFPGSHIVGITNMGWKWFSYVAVIASCLCIIVYTLFNMYNNLWKYASIDEVVKIFIASTIVFILLFIFDLFILSKRNLLPLSRRMYIVSWMVNCLLVTFSRFGYRLVKRLFILLSHTITSKAGCRRVLVVGAGFSGYGVVRGMQNSTIRDKLPVLVVDPDVSKNNTSLLGVRVLGGLSGIPNWVLKYEIDEIIIALPSAAPEELREAIDMCTKTDCLLKIMPPLSDVSEGATGFNQIRDVSISDILYREEIKLDTKNISSYLKNRVVLVTGGGGSIGSELCRQIAGFAPSCIIIFDIYENNAFELQNELNSVYGGQINIVLRIGSVRDVNRLNEVFEEFHPQVVFHAAAHKHVPLMEENKAEAVKNNVFGTLNTVRCAERYGAERFVLISTDKAVNPNNAYGATKRIAEMIIQNINGSKTKFMAVRFGNVLGSNGSVLHRFKQQIAKGGPVTVTHPDMVRFFMTIPEAAQLVLQAVSMGQTGKIYVLEMGTPINIDEMARKLIRLAGFRPDTDIKIEYIGIRPGDKLFEELILEEEKDNMQVSCHKKVFITKPITMDAEKFYQQLDRLEIAAIKKPEQVNELLHEIVPNYKES